MFGVLSFDSWNHNILDVITVFTIISGVYVIISKNPIISILYLIGLFGGIASYLILIGLNFLGLSYLIIYVGAVSILFLFILMLINIRISELKNNNSNSIPLGIIISILISSLLPSAASAAKLQPKSFTIEEASSNNWENLVEVNSIANIGNVLYTSHNTWLIITSLILVLAMVGTIVLSKK